MGQAFRRATGRITEASTGSSSKTKNVVDRETRVGPTDEMRISGTAPFDGRHDTNGNPPVNVDNVLEERDLQCDTMLNQMLEELKQNLEGNLTWAEADDHNGLMDAKQIAQKFRLDVVQVQTILQFVSQPPENTSKQKDYSWLDE